LWVVMSALSSLPGPLIDGSNQAIWQAKVPPDLQGRVFSARLLIAWITNPISPLIAGLMGDYVLEPAMRVPTGILPAMFGWLTPPGPGAGMGLLIFLSCFGGVIAGVAGYLSHHTRNAETIPPDHDELPNAEAQQIHPFPSLPIFPVPSYPFRRYTPNARWLYWCARR